jgi:hypothetical protein
MAGMALAALIDSIEEINEWKDTRVVRQATDRGHKLTSSDISDYRHRGMRTIVPAKILALAAGLQIPAYRVALAILHDVGIIVPQDVRTPEDAIANDHTLSAFTRDSLLVLIDKDRGRR